MAADLRVYFVEEDHGHLALEIVGLNSLEHVVEFANVIEGRNVDFFK